MLEPRLRIRKNKEVVPYVEPRTSPEVISALIEAIAYIYQERGEEPNYDVHASYEAWDFVSKLKKLGFKVVPC